MLLARRFLEAPAQSRLTIHNFYFHCFLARVARTDKKAAAAAMYMQPTALARDVNIIQRGQNCQYSSLC
jgi:hypothetical protein